MRRILKQLHEEELAQALIEIALIGHIVALGALAGMGKLSTKNLRRSRAA